MQISTESQWARSFDQRVDELAQLIRERPNDLPVIFEDEQEMFAVLYRAPDLRARCFFLDFESHELSQVTPARLIARDVTRRYGKHYAGLQFVRPRDVLQFDRFFIVPFRDQSQLGFASAGFDRRRVDDKLYEFSAKDNA